MKIHGRMEQSRIVFESNFAQLLKQRIKSGIVTADLQENETNKNAAFEVIR